MPRIGVSAGQNKSFIIVTLRKLMQAVQWPLYPRHNCIIYIYITLSICKITTKLYCGFRCHGDLFCNRTVLLDLTNIFLNGFLKVLSFSRNDMIRLTVPYRNNAVSIIIFPYVIMTVMLNKFKFIT